MLKVFTATAVFLAASVGFAGTAKQLKYEEQKVVAFALVEIIPSMLRGDNGTLEECDLMNVAPVGTPSKMEVHCLFTAPSGIKADASFDGITLDQNGDVVTAKFKSLERR